MDEFQLSDCETRCKSSCNAHNQINFNDCFVYIFIDSLQLNYCKFIAIIENNLVYQTQAMCYDWDENDNEILTMKMMKFLFRLRPSFGCSNTWLRANAKLLMNEFNERNDETKEIWILH